MGGKKGLTVFPHQTRTSRAASEKCQEGLDNSVQSKGSVLWGVNGNVSFTVIILFYFKHSLHFMITTRTIENQFYLWSNLIYSSQKLPEIYLKVI